MEQITISLSPEHRARAERLAALGKYPDIGAFLATLIDARAKAQTQLEALLLEGLEGSFEPWEPGDMGRILEAARIDAARPGGE